MPYIGLSFHVLVALFFAVHAIRSGQQLYWLFILFAFPLLGSIVYFVAVFLPASRLEHGAMRAVSAAAKVLDPGKDLRMARQAFEDTPTAQNQMRLAAALLDAGQADEAAQRYEGALQGPFANDPEIRYGASRAFVECQRFNDALVHIDTLRQTCQDYRPDAVALLQARCYAGLGRNAQAHEAFQQTIDRFGTFEAHAEYAIWALAIADAALAARLQTQIDKMTSRWNAMAREHNEPVLRRLQAAQQLASKRNY